jgi:hypothetical protein
MSKIDLGKSLGDMISVEPMDPDDKHYPTLHLDSDDPKLADIPDSGECTIRYKVRDRTHRKEKGKKDSCSLTLEVTSIDPPPAKSKKKNGDSDGGARKALSNYFKDK